MPQQPSLKAIHCLICDDVRIEVGYKETLIGVYTTGITIPILPWTGFVCIWMSVIWSGEGEVELEVRVLDPRSESIGNAQGRGHAAQQGRESSVTFRNLMFKVASEGTHMIQWRIVGGANWETVKSFPVAMLLGA